MPEIEAILQDRIKTHGEYSEHARCTQNIMRALQAECNWEILPDIIKETLHMSAHKMARIATGNPFMHDHYDDICGYCKLVVQRTVDGIGLQEKYKDPNSKNG